jgi:hypothetical protein
VSRTLALLPLVVALAVTTAYADGEKPATSVYTDLSGPDCTIVREDKVTGALVQACPGIAGYRLLVATDDARMSVTVIDPAGVEHGLDYWTVVTRSFSSLGPKAEWRVSGQQGATPPVALIVRVNASEQQDPSKPKKVSYLAVAKITPERICVTDSIRPAPDANERARRAADHSASKPCLSP